MILSKIVMENWQPFQGRHEINVPTGLIRIQGRNLDNEGAVSNRSGKTSLLNIIPATLFNKTPLVARSGNLINENADSANLELIFKVVDGLSGFSVKRYFKDKKFQNLIFSDSKSTTQDQLEKSLGMNFESFVATVFFGTNFSDFLEKILRRPAEAKDLLISLLPNLQVFDIALEWIKKKILETDAFINQIERTIAVNIGKLESYQNMNYAAEIEKFEQDRLKNISREEKEITNLKEELKVKEKENIPNLEIVYKKFLVDKNYIQEKYNEISNAYSTILTASKYLEREIDSLKKEIRTLETGKCPTCGQSLPKRTDVLTEKNELLNTKMKQMGINNLKTDKLYKELDKIGIELEATKQEEGEFEKLRALNIKILNLKNTIVNKQSNITRLVEQKNPHITKEAEAAKAMIEIQKEIGKLKTDSEIEKGLLQYYFFWEKGFGPRGVRNFIFDEVIFRLSSVSQKYLDVLTENTIQIRFDPRKEKKSGGFIETIGLEISNKGNSRDFFTWSSSERKKVSLAVSFAMHELLSEMFSSNFDFFVLDEVFDSLDTIGIELVCRALKEQLKRTPQIFVVSHSDALPDIFDHTITIVKENGQSRIENNSVIKPKLLRRNK